MNKVLKKKSQGFTLLEMLFVLAIIGILSSVVLASLSSSRLNSIDGAIKANLNSTIAQADRFYDQNGGTYCGSPTCVCDTGAIDGIRPMVISAAKQLNANPNVLGNAQPFVYNTNGTSAGSTVCHNVPAGGWAAIVSLKKPVTPNSGWCVDYTGAAKETTILTASSVICGQ
jgi:type IV pilus assembly protein PilA